MVITMQKLKQAIDVAKKSLEEIQDNVTDIAVEEGLLNDSSSQYEITLSYKLAGKDNADEKEASPGIASLLAISSVGRIYKTFLVDEKTGEFKGFKIFKEA